MQFKTILVVAMLCLAMAGVSAAAEDVKACWEPCGTPVEQCDKDTTFVLFDMPNATIVESIDGYFYIDVEPDFNSNNERILTVNDIRLTIFHDKYLPNTQIMPSDQDNKEGNNLIVEEYNSAISYADLNQNGKYDLTDGVVYDLDGNDVISAGDILQTDLPATDINTVVDNNGVAELELFMTQGELGQAWTWVTLSHPAVGTELTTISSGSASELIHYVDADNSDTYNKDDKVYLIQPHDSESWWMDMKVTIGDTRVFIPADDPCIPECGTKVIQGDHDATYLLMKNLNAQLAYYTHGVIDGIPTEVYVDMDSDNRVSLGDIRLTEVSTHYPPNSKVVPSNRFDLGHELTTADQTIVRYAETDGLVGYTLGDAVYIDLTDDNVVTPGDIRLVEVSVYEQGFEDPFVYAAWSVVASNDVDVGDDLFGLLDTDGVRDGGDYTALNELLGYIDSDCSGDWTCPDKLYLQQIVDKKNYDHAVTVGDLRLYVPVNDPVSPWYGLEEWPYCGTKVTSCDIDVEYALTYMFTDYAWIKFVDKDNDGVFSDDDNAYIDMDGSDDVSTGDVRLTDVAIDGEWFYFNNTKVGDQHEGDKGDEMLPADGALMSSDRDLLGVVPSSGFEVYLFDNDCSRDWTCVDVLYLKLIDSHERDNYFVTHGDIRLFVPPELIGEANGEDPQEPECPYDTNDNQQIDIEDVNTIIDNYRTAGGMTISDVNAVIDMYRTGSYCE
ncbi:hypothetical protein J2755_002079 [Methanohalophilus levihalophilus]|uniref:hypothetical protein n=1 Tax=Methanohalophilus levihalophilus TaxID=1431282 RepID=UPI001AE88365|nr:hypothetical protein [Methanohalophilus levihalophilus]MBP2031131.1 hypothetical protein [Methanohalophilus levihalophilus]